MLRGDVMDRSEADPVSLPGLLHPGDAGAVRRPTTIISRNLAPLLVPSVAESSRGGLGA